jgi:hypothetical protein
MKQACEQRAAAAKEQKLWGVFNMPSHRIESVDD